MLFSKGRLPLSLRVVFSQQHQQGFGEVSGSRGVCPGGSFGKDMILTLDCLPSDPLPSPPHPLYPGPNPLGCISQALVSACIASRGAVV